MFCRENYEYERGLDVASTMEWIDTESRCLEVIVNGLRIVVVRTKVVVKTIRPERIGVVAM